MGTKALLIGDTHVYPYANYNLFDEKDFRLNQFYRLMDRLIEIGNEYNCEYLFNLGDFTHKPIMNPRTLAGVKTCFEILSRKWDKDHHFLISGNHDLDGKSSSLQAKDSSLYVFNQFYTDMDHKIIQMDNKSLAFMNWTADQDLSWIEKPVDYFFGHLTPYVEGAMFGQEIDWSKFKVGFAGDYHQPKTFNGKLHTTNVVIPHYISDHQDGSVVVLDIETGEWERVQTRKAGSFNHLRIFYDDVAVPDEDEYTVRVKRPLPTAKSQHIHGSINLDEVIENVVKSAGKVEIHNSIIKEVSSNEEVLSLNFLLKSLKVKNFRSISEFEMVFDNGLYCFTSGNGEGKSSLINSIAYCLNPPRSSKDLIKRGQDEMSVELELEYQGLDHKILRSTTTKGSSVKYWVNGEEIPANNSSELNSKINENLQFMQLWDILYRFQSAPYLLSGYSYSQRIDMVSKLLGLGKVKDIYQVAYSKLKLLKQDSDLYAKRIDIEKAVLESMEVIDESEIKDVTSLEQHKSDLQSQIAENEKQLTEIRRNNEVLKQLNLKVSELELLDSQLDKTFSQESLDEAKSSESQGLAYISEKKAERAEAERAKQEIEVQIAKLEYAVSDSESKLNSLKSSERKCSACGREFDDKEEFELHVKSESEKHETLKQEVEIKVSELKAKLESVNLEISHSNQAIFDSEEALKSLSSVISKLERDRVELARFNTKQDEFNQFLAQHPEVNDIKEVSESGVLNSISELKQQITGIEFSIIESSRKLEVISKRKVIEEKIKDAEKGLESSLALTTSMEEYARLFHPTGDVIKSVFLKVAQNLTSNDYVVSTIKTLASGEDRIDFDMKMMVDGGLIDYDSLSGGQKVMCDMFFLTRLFEMSGNVGLLMLDETLKDLDPNNLESASQMIKSAPINTVLLVTHSESFNNYDYKFNVRKENGCSVYQIEG